MPSAFATIPNLCGMGSVTELDVLPIAGVVQSLQGQGKSLSPLKVLAMIDTGATGSVIQQGLLSTLGIFPVGTVCICTPSSTNVQCPVYAVQILFPSLKMTMTKRIIEAPLQGQQIQFLIGRDILRHAVFIYQGPTDSFTLAI